MITSKKTQTLSLHTYASFIAVNSKRKPFASEERTEQGCMIHLTTEEAQQLGDAVPDMDFNRFIKVYNELEYLEKFKSQPPSGYLHKGLVRTLNVKNNDPQCANTIKLVGARSGDTITEDPLYRTAVSITLEVFEYTFLGKSGTALRLIEVEVLEA